MSKFTVNSEGIAIRITSKCTVEAYSGKRESIKSVECSKALWDTGASVSVISTRIASELSLVPTGVSYITGFDGRRMRTNTYRVNIILPDGISIGCLEVVESPMVMFDMLIGMDVISLGDFSICNRGRGGTVFSFEMD